MYSAVQFEDDRQLECLTCLSTGWRLSAIRLLMSNETLVLNSTIKDGQFEFQLPPGQSNFDFLICGAFRFVSLELAAFLESRIKAEFLSVNLLRSKKHRHFRLLHMLERHSAMDRDHSVFSERSDELGGGISEIKKLVLSESALSGVNGFILNETGMLFFEDGLCQEILDAGFRGLKFCPSALVTFGC